MVGRVRSTENLLRSPRSMARFRAWGACLLLLVSAVMVPSLAGPVRGHAAFTPAVSFPPPPPRPNNITSLNFYWNAATLFGLPGVAETFTAFVSGVSGPITASFWFGDGTPQSNFTMNLSTFSLQHTFTANGTYNVILNISYSQGFGGMGGFFVVAQTQTVGNVTVALYLPWSSGYAPYAAYPTFLAFGGVSPYAFAVDYGNGQFTNYTSPAANATGMLYGNATYSSVGDYTISATITDGRSQSVNITTEVYVGNPPRPPYAMISASPISGSAPLTVNLTATFENASWPGNFTYPHPAHEWNWTFGDGGVGYGTQVVHTYHTAGTFNVTLRIPFSVGPGQNFSTNFSTWAYGNITVTVTGSSSSGSNGNQSGTSPLVAKASLLSTTGTTAVTAEFQISVSGGSLPYSVQVVFGDGSYGIAVPGQTVTHLYTKAGVFDPYAVVTDGKGVSLTLALPAITVRAPSATSSLLSLPPDFAIYALVGAMLALILATAFLVRSRARRRQSSADEGEAIVRELLRGPEP